MAQSNIKLIISAEDKASGVLRSLSAEAKSVFDSLASKAKAVAGGLAAWKLMDLAKDSTMLAARVETLGIVMNTVGRNAGYSSGQMQSFMEGVRSMGITTQESQHAIIRLTQAQLDLSKSSQLARVAQDAAVIGNVNSSEALERLIHGITTLNPRVLRQIGIMVDLESEYSRFTKTSGLTLESLTSHEKQQIAFNAVLEQGRKIFGAYEAAMGTAGKQMTTLSRHWEEAKVQFGQLFLPLLSVVVVKLTDQLKGLGGSLQELKNSGRLDEWATSLATSINTIISNLKLFGSVTIEVARNIDILVLGLGYFAATAAINGIIGMTGAFSKLAEAIAIAQAAATKFLPFLLFYAAYKFGDVLFPKLEMPSIAVPKNLEVFPKKSAEEAKANMASLAKEWEKTRRDLETEISGTGLDEFSKKILDIGNKAEDMRVKFKDVYGAEEEIARWSASKITEIKQEQLSKMVETAKDAYSKILEAEKTGIEDQISAAEALRDKLKEAYQEAIEKAKEFEGVAKQIADDMSKRQDFLSEAGKGQDKTPDELSTAAWKQWNQILETAEKARSYFPETIDGMKSQADEVKGVLDSMERYYRDYAGKKDDFGLSLFNESKFRDQYQEYLGVYERIKANAQELAGLERSNAEGIKEGIAAQEDYLNSLQEKIKALDAEITKVREFKIDTKQANADLDALIEKMKSVGSTQGQVNLPGGSAAGGSTQGINDLIVKMGAMVTDPANRGNNAILVNMTQAIQGLGGAVSANTGAINGQSQTLSGIMNGIRSDIQADIDAGRISIAEANRQWNEINESIRLAGTDQGRIYDQMLEERRQSGYDNIWLAAAADYSSSSYDFSSAVEDFSGAVQALTQGGGGTIGEYAGGGYVPKTGNYKLHEDEWVLRADQWRGMFASTDGGAGGGSSFAAPKGEKSAPAASAMKFGSVTLNVQGSENPSFLARKLVRPVEMEIRRLNAILK